MRNGKPKIVGDYAKAGDVGYIISGIKKANEVKVGDTITSISNPCDVVF